MSEHTRIHTYDRLNLRGLPYTREQLEAIAARYTKSTAVILGRRPNPEGPRYGYEKIVLIVRDREPITIMCRRENQSFTCANFDVEQVVEEHLS